MAKRVDPLKAKQAKQRKMLIGLGVVFAAVLAFQLPRTLKMLKGPAAPVPEAVAPVAATAPTGAPPVVPATVAAGTPVAAGAAVVAPGAVAQPAVLTDSDLPAAAGEGQLLSFETFKSKDPFAQQVVAPKDGVVSPSVPGPSPTTVAAPPGSSRPSESAPSAPSATPELGVAPSAIPSIPAPGSTPAPVPTEPVAPPAAETSISVNGSAEAVVLAASFPAATPTFTLVSLAKDGKSVQLGIAGGDYADGAATIKLSFGKKLTLRNTADGTRYELELMSVQGFVTPKPAPTKQ